MSYTFNNKRYITRGIEATIPTEIILLLWSLIDNMKITEKDYLQVFKLSVDTENGYIKQNITHTQERPPYEANCIAYFNKQVTAKIFVIDDISHNTMLLAEEY